MSSLSPIRPKNFREKVFFRKLRSQVDGNKKVENGLTQIKGIGRRFAQAIIRVAEINPNMRIGALPEKDLNKIEEIILKPVENGIPNWMVNRKKDLRDGEDKHVIGSQLEITIKRDIDRMKRMKSYKGVRHHLGLKVRGQRTKSTGRHGLVIGVSRKTKRQQKKLGEKK
jgi:small subunit ribosomal protein S13